MATATIKDAQILRKYLLRLRSETGLRVMISTDTDIWNEILLNDRIPPEMLDLNELRKLRNISSVWLE